MRFFTIIRFIAAVAVFSALAFTLVVVQRALSDREDSEPAKNKVDVWLPHEQASEEAVAALVAKLEVENAPDVTPGERAFESARELLLKGDYYAAEEKLKYVNTYYPTAMSSPEARRILGEMNMDRLFDGKQFAKFSTYKVKSGDSLYKIVREQKMNLDLLVFLNDLKRTDRLHPGDEFRVLVLDYRLVIDFPQGIVSLWDGPRYIKGYDIVRSTMPKGSGTRNTTIAAVEAVYKSKRASLPSSTFRSAQKIIVLKRPQVEIRSVTASKDDGLVGLFLENQDIEELALLLRPSNSVEIRY